MKINLGYACLALTLEDTTYNKTITYTNYQKLSLKDTTIKLNQLITHNLHNLKTILKYNYQNHIHFFRLSPNLIPLATHPHIHFDYITPYLKEWQSIGKKLQKYQIRMDTHLDQYCVLNSISPQVREASIATLEYNYQIFQAMNYHGLCITHIGGATGGKEAGLKRFKETYTNLPKHLQKLIILENDDKIYNVNDTLTLCEELNIPMVLDYHHHLCNHQDQNIEPFLNRIYHTWDNLPYPPKIHFSSPKNTKDFRAHSDYINYKDFIIFLNTIKQLQQDIDIMLECKAKDLALFRLIRQLKIYSPFHIKNTTIIIK